MINWNSPCSTNDRQSVPVKNQLEIIMCGYCSISPMRCPSWPQVNTRMFWQCCWKLGWWVEQECVMYHIWLFYRIWGQGFLFMGWLVRHSLEPTNPFKTHLGKTPSLTIIDIHLSCDIWCIIGSFINQTKFLPKLILCQISLVSSGQPSHKYFKKYFKQNLQVFHKYFANISETERENCTFAKYFQPWRPVVSQNSENIMITHLRFNHELI